MATADDHCTYSIRQLCREFDATARHLIAMFQKNFEQFATHVDPDVNDAAPVVREAAE